MRIGFIGYGGAAYGLSKGLKETGPTEIFFFDSLLEASPDRDVILRRAEETGAVVNESLEELINRADIIISCVTGSVALPVARQAARSLGQHHLYVDVNTASPKIMEAVGGVIMKRGAAFADVAMMGGIPAFLHRVPCLASGNGAEQFKGLMQPYGMDITCVGDTPGQASAIKMFRSIFMKGFLALLMEMLSATHQYQVDTIVLESIRKTMEQNDFLEIVRLQMVKGVINAERMGYEMEAVVQILTEMGLPSQMASAAKAKLEWCSSLKLEEDFGHNLEAPLTEVLDALEAKACQ